MSKKSLKSKETSGKILNVMKRRPLHNIKKEDLSEKVPPMDYLDIKYALAKKGYTLTKLAEELGLYGPQSVQQVLIRKYISARVELHVSKIIDVPLEKLFPDRYKNSTVMPERRSSQKRHSVLELQKGHASL